MHTLVTVDAVLALRAGLTGRPVEALSTLTDARAIHSIQTDPISEAAVPSIPWARLALGAKEARTALSPLKRKDEAGPPLPSSVFVSPRCRNPMFP